MLDTAASLELSEHPQQAVFIPSRRKGFIPAMENFQAIEGKGLESTAVGDLEMANFHDGTA